VGAALLLLPLQATAAHANDEDPWNFYEVVGLPAVALGNVTGTVQVDGANPVCQMTDARTGVTLTAPPWQFPITAGTSGVIDIQQCNGNTEQARYRLESGIDVSGTLGRKGATWRVSAVSSMDSGYTLAAVDSTGRELVRATGQGLVRMTIPRQVASRARTLVAALPDGQRASFPLMYQDGWSVENPFSDMTSAAAVHRFANCQRLTWSYSRKGQPGTASRAISDVRRAFARLAKETGLTFAQVPAGKQPPARPDGSSEAAVERYFDALAAYNADESSHPDIAIGWARYQNGPAGIGGMQVSSGSFGNRVAGHVTLNSASSWAARGRPGFGYLGRGWLAVHEIMHAIGLQHVEDRESIMYPVNHGQVRLSKGDRAGLTALYPKSCPA
jgi:hypothetical protein